MTLSGGQRQSNYSNHQVAGREIRNPGAGQKIRSRSPENDGRLILSGRLTQAGYNHRAAGRKKTKSRFEKFLILKSCATVVIALATLAGGLLLIRLCGEQRLQSLLDMSFLKKACPQNDGVSENHPAAMVANQTHSH